MTLVESADKILRFAYVQKTVLGIDQRVENVRGAELRLVFLARTPILFMNAERTL